jgi:hypothetical protein
VNLFTVYKVFEAVMSVVGGRKEARAETPAPEDGRPLAQTFANQVETRLTNIVVAALKEAFDRDHQRLELERARLDEERRFAEERARMEAWRRAVDREIGRLRVLTGAGVLGWITSVALLIVRADNMYAPARAVLLGGSGLLLLSLAAAFTAQATIGTLRETDGSLRTKAATASLSFLIAGMAAAAISLVI